MLTPHGIYVDPDMAKPSTEAIIEVLNRDQNRPIRKDDDNHEDIIEMAP